MPMISPGTKIPGDGGMPPSREPAFLPKLLSSRIEREIVDTTCGLSGGMLIGPNVVVR
jgi:hypothetical protein